MTNFINLCLNENSKIYKKNFTWIFLILLIFSLFIAIVTNYLMESKNIVKEELKVSNYKLKEELKYINISIMNSEDIDKSELEALNIKKECYEYVINNNIPLDGGVENGYYRYNILNEIISLKTSLINDTNVNEKEEVEEKVDSLVSMLSQDNYDEYIKYEINNINKNYENGIITEKQRETFLDIKNLEKNMK